jgi:hypothetical protein
MSQANYNKTLKLVQDSKIDLISSRGNIRHNILTNN